MKMFRWWHTVAAMGLVSTPVDAVMFLGTGDIQHNTSTPGDNSGWQYEGKFNSFLGVPIAPHFFITAKHIGGSVGNTFDFHGEIYTTIAIHDSPSTDLRIWEVDHAKPFPTYAPLSSGVADVGGVIHVMGRGTRRGTEVIVAGEEKGWQWGPSDDVQRWGRNIVVGTTNGGETLGELLYCDFDKPGIAEECHLSVGDSGGGAFVFENGLWRLAGINYAVDGPFREGPSGTAFSAALYDCGGLEVSNGASWVVVPNTTADQPASFYCSRISASLSWISSIAPAAGALAPENFQAWRQLYFSPAEIVASTDAGIEGDFDHDGISNLLEFALNLDPTFSERATMAAASGTRGLPLVRTETIGGVDRVTVEFVRRTSGSGAGTVSTAQFSSDLTDWQGSGTETIVSINPRWERVKVVDSAPVGNMEKRFARIRVIQN